jgi:hypothetical protein
MTAHFVSFHVFLNVSMFFKIDGLFFKMGVLFVAIPNEVSLLAKIHGAQPLLNIF